MRVKSRGFPSGFRVPDYITTSRSLVDRKYAFEALKEAGAYLTTSERIILGLAPDAAHPKFRQIQKIVMTSAEDTGLLL